MKVVERPPPQTLRRSDACATDSVSEDLPPVNENVTAGRYHQHLGFKKGLAIASLNTNGLRSHLDEVQLLIRDLGIQILE